MFTLEAGESILLQFSYLVGKTVIPFGEDLGSLQKKRREREGWYKGEKEGKMSKKRTNIKMEGKEREGKPFEREGDG